MKGLPLALALLLLLTGVARAAKSPPQPTRAALKRVLERHRASAVLVRGPKQKGPGIFVGARGQVLTSVDYVGLENAQVEFFRKKLPATVSLAHAALGIAMVEVEAGPYPAVPVQAAASALTPGRWLVGVLPGPHGQNRPLSARIRKAKPPFVELALPLPAGSPLFDDEGRLVALCVRNIAGRCRATSMEAVKVQLASQGAP